MEKLLLQSKKTHEESANESSTNESPTPRPLSAQFEHPNKEEAVEKFKTMRRFSH